MKKNIYIVAIALFAIVSLFSCDKNFEEYNANIDDPAIIPSDQLLGTIVRDVANELYSTFNGSEIGENWIQHNSLIQYNDPDRYKPRETSMDNIWTRLYLAASTAKQMYKLAEGEGNEVNMGIAVVLKSYCFSLITDFYGDAPYSEALQGAEGIRTPVYDKQEDIYAGLFTDLDEALTLLDGAGSMDANLDILYAGNVTKWKKFATTLKFRMAMRMSATDNGASVAAIVNSGMLFGSNADEAKLVYLSSAPNANPIYEQVVAGNRNEHALAQTFVDFLVDNSDPRLPIYAQPNAAAGAYVGKPNGYADSPLPGFGYDDVSAIGTKYLEAEAPGYFISYSEVLFLLAEAAKQGYISGGDATAQQYYEDGIRNSFAENGAPNVDSYLTRSGIAYSSVNALEQIGTQKWVVLFCQGFEAWTEWRRTGYPVLAPAAEGYINEIPSRLKYNTTEVTLNTANYNAAIADQGADELTTKVWWMN